MTDSTPPAEQTSPAEAPPRARLARERRWSWSWLAPLAALGVTGFLGYQAWVERGTVVTIRFAHGHGVKTGDVLRYRGVAVGEVRQATVSPELDFVEIDVSVTAEADALARAGSRFWIVRPRIDLTGVEGLETLMGANYLAVLPGDGPPQTRFDGLEQPPIDEPIEPDGLEIVLQAPRRGSLRPGAAVNYRQFRVGTLLSVGLASDASAVEARAYIRPAYRELIRQQTRFWDSGRVELSANWLSGVSLSLDSAEALVAGGVSLATPPEAGEPVSAGHRFTLADEPEEEWLGWSPSLLLGAGLLPSGAPAPRPERANLSWKKKGSLWNRSARRQGWLLAVEGGVLGPADLLLTPDGAADDTAHLSIAGRQLALSPPARNLPGGLALLPSEIADEAWPRARIRLAEAPEDTLLITEPAAPLFLSAARYRQEEGVWLIDRALSFDPSWHGAVAVSLRDGALIGVLLLDDAEPRVAPIELPR